ncbi:MAG: response regulator [Abditibacteriales bacterium]|nr:response regulator [Abditibacteriales bacterium]MDW8365636.1 response regulator [Abditibacteriales bacterium]
MRILIAEDDVANRRLLEATLQRMGYEVVTTQNGEEAWQVLQGDDAPSLVILDWMMPYMDGIEVCRRVRALPKPRLIYIIMLTAKGQREDIVTGLSAGADDYITKPFDREELQARLQVGERMLELQKTLAEQEKQLAVTRAVLLERERFDAAIAAMDDGILVTDGDWRITSANRAACRLLNLPMEAWMGMSLEDALAPFTLSEPLSEMPLAHGSTIAFEIGRLNTQPPLYLDAHLTCLFDPPNTLSSTVLTLRDITAERHAQRLQANFFMLVSHKLRTPLTIVGGFLDLVHRLPAERFLQERESLLDICLSELRRLEETVEKLLNFKALSTQQFEAASQHTDVAAAVAAASEQIHSRYPSKTIAVTTAIAPDATHVDTRADHCQILLEQLLDNAAKFGDKDPVRVAVEVERSDPSRLRFSVRDNGPGIPHEYYDRVFEGFVQIEEHVTGQVPGLGIGLFTARQIVRAYGGDISLQSRLGEGTTVTFTLPAAASAEESVL